MLRHQFHSTRGCSPPAGSPSLAWWPLLASWRNSQGLEAFIKPCHWSSGKAAWCSQCRIVRSRIWVFPKPYCTSWNKLFNMASKPRHLNVSVSQLEEQQPSEEIKQTSICSQEANGCVIIAWAHIESEQGSQYKNSDKYIQNWLTNTVLMSSSPWPLEFGWEVVVFYVCCHLFSQWCCLPPPAQTCWALWIITISIARFSIQVIKIQIHLHKEYTCLEKWARAFLSSVMGHCQLKGTQPTLWQ